MLAARDAGITFLDDARYDDETGSAPIETGYSEVVFGELFRQAGWRRDETDRGQQAVVGVLAATRARPPSSRGRSPACSSTTST